MSRMTVGHKLATDGKKGFIGKKIEMDNTANVDIIPKDSYLKSKVRHLVIKY